MDWDRGLGFRGGACEAWGLPLEVLGAWARAPGLGVELGTFKLLGAGLYRGYSLYLASGANQTQEKPFISPYNWQTFDIGHFHLLSACHEN